MMYLKFAFFIIAVQGSKYCVRPEVFNCSTPERIGGVDGAHEVSGIALGRGNPQHIYAIQDSGAEKPEVVIVDKNTGLKVNTWTINVTNENYGGGGGWGDWESITLAKCPENQANWCVVIGDLGYNWARNGDGQQRTKPPSLVYFEEPKVGSAPSSINAKRIHVTFKDCRTFDVEAITYYKNKILFFTKNKRVRNDPSKNMKYSLIYELPFDGTIKFEETEVYEIKPRTEGLTQLTAKFGEVTDGTVVDYGNLNAAVILHHRKGFYLFDIEKNAGQKQACYYEISEFIGNKQISEALTFDWVAATYGQFKFYAMFEDKNPKLQVIKCTGTFFNDPVNNLKTDPLPVVPAMPETEYKKLAVRWQNFEKNGGTGGFCESTPGFEGNGGNQPNGGNPPNGGNNGTPATFNIVPILFLLSC